MTRGRRPGPDSAEAKAAIRREKVRLNVQAYRRRKAAMENTSNGGSSKLSLKWVENTQWQTEYERHPKSVKTTSHSNESTMQSARGARLNIPIRTSDQASPQPSMCSMPDPTRLYSQALLAMFPDRFLPTQLSLTATSDAKKLQAPCALWIMTATKLAYKQESGALSDVLLSIILATVSVDMRCDDLRIEASRLYSRCLAKTRRDLEPMLNGDKSITHTLAQEVVLTCHAAAVYEFMVTQSMADMIKHVNGIGLLLKHQNRTTHYPSLVGESLVDEYRMLEIHFCLMNRQLSTPWRVGIMGSDDIPTSHSEATASHQINVPLRLLCIADQLLPLMVEHDSYSDECPVTAGRLSALLQHALQLHAGLESWASVLRERYHLCCENASGSVDLAEHIELSQMSQYELASCYICSLSYDVHVLGFCVELANALAVYPHAPASVYCRPSTQALLLRTEALQVTGAILELIPYFLQSDKGIIGRSFAMWPLEAAWRLLDQEHSRLLHDEQICASTASVEIEEKFHKQTAENRTLVTKYYQTCRDSGRRAHSFNLPLLSPRSVE